MKILHLISSGGMYGAEGMIINISRMLNGGPNQSLLGVFSNSKNPNLQLYERAVSEGIETYVISCKGRFDTGAIANIRELVNRSSVDVVHAHGYKADVFVYLALKQSGIPFVSTCHNWLDIDLKGYCYGVIDRFILRRYAQVVAVSEDVRQRLIDSGVDETRIHVINNGIDLRPFDRVSAILKRELDWDGYFLIGLVGRLSPEKGVDIFLQAASAVVSQFPNAKFVVAGDGPDRDKLDALIQKLSISNSVRMLGRRTDMPSVYASLDILVCASRREGMPLAVLEGMASRLPMVATAVGQLPKIIRDGRTGLLVPGEDPGLLAEAITELLRNPTKRKELGFAGRQFVEEAFSGVRMATEYLTVYREAIAVSGNTD